MGKLEVLYSIKGNHLAAILLAAGEAERRSIPLDGYELTLLLEFHPLIIARWTVLQGEDLLEPRA